jgi:hypothetical protein
VRKRFLIAGVWLGGGLLALLTGAYALFQASQHVPEFYLAALQTDRLAQEEASHQMLQRATTLASQVQKEGRWEGGFTAEEINGWLAVDMLRNHRELLPSAVKDPRVVIDSGELTVACRVQRGKWSGVVSLAVDAYLARPNVIALRIRGARAGVLPLPLDNVLDRISNLASAMDLHTRWWQAEGDPVVEISIPQPRDAKGKVVRIEALDLGPGEIYVSGSTERELERRRVSRAKQDPRL